MTSFDKVTPRNMHNRGVAIDLAREGRLTEQRLAKAIHVSPRQARQWIRKLSSEGLIVHIGLTKALDGVGRPHKVWTLPTSRPEGTRSSRDFETRRKALEDLKGTDGHRSESRHHYRHPKLSAP